MFVESNPRRIELVCPDCLNKQFEPSMVVSTQCRECGKHIEVKDGKAVARRKYSTRLATAKRPPTEHPPVKERGPKLEVKVLRPGFFRRLFVREPSKREVSCYHCSLPFQVVSDAQSSQCPKCGGYISLRNYEIAEPWRRRIQTRGDVLISKTGSIVGVPVQCHHLTVLGKLSAPVDCSGDLVIRSHGRVIGHVKCRSLRIERGAVVEFQGDVEARSAFIDGEVRAQITCTGTITLEKKAHLQGLARAGALVVKSGARHTGQMEVVNAKVAE